MWLQSVHVNDDEVSGSEIDLTGGAATARARITLSRGAGRIEGAVIGEDGSTLAPGPHLVILSQRRGEEESGKQKLVPAGEKFQFTSLAPGQYRLSAVAAVETAGGIDSIQAGRAKALEIEVHEGDKLTRNIKVTTPGSADATK
jgi:hypothetical protein